MMVIGLWFGLVMLKIAFGGYISMSEGSRYIGFGDRTVVLRCWISF